MATRVDTRQLKETIYRKIGLKKGIDYFIQLERFLNLKLTKIEFDKSCRQIFGRENLHLHNLLIRSIIGNARIPQKEARKAVVNCVKKTHVQTQPKFFLGKDRKCKGIERLSPLGPLGKSPSLTNEESVSRFQEQQGGAEEGEEVDQSAGKLGPHWCKSVTGDLISPLCKSPSFTHEEMVPKLQEQQSGAEEGEKVDQSVGKLGPHRWKSVTGDLTSPLCKSPSLTHEETVLKLQEQQQSVALEDKKAEQPAARRRWVPRWWNSVIAPVDDISEQQQSGPEEEDEGRWGPHLWKDVTAPIGVSHNTGGVDLRSNKRCFDETCQSSGELPDTNSLGRHVLRKMAKDGVVISRDGANLLNRSLDIYLKKIISQCVGVAPFNGKQVSGFIEISPGQYVETPSQQTCVSLLDFRVAMESNPSVLGESWPLHLEKIQNYPFQ